jgi:hypothetical protein
VDSYEIRLLRDDGSPAVIAEEIYLCDQAAIRAAEGIAHGKSFEVWRGIDCIFSAQPAAILKVPSAGSFVVPRS